MGLPSEVRALALRDTVVLPGGMAVLLVGREKSVLALQEALETDRLLAVLLQKNKDVNNPRPEDLISVGVVCKITQHLHLPSGNLKVLFEGLERILVQEKIETSPFLKLKPKGFTDKSVSVESSAAARELFEDVSMEFERLAQHEYVVGGFDEAGPPDSNTQTWHKRDRYDALRTVFRSEDSRRSWYRYLTPIPKTRDLGTLADWIAPSIATSKEDLIFFLTEPDGEKRLQRAQSLLKEEIRKVNWDHDIRERVFMAIEEQHREIYLREQLKVILQDLGEHGPVALHNPVFRGRGFKVNQRLAFVLMPFDEEFYPVFTDIIRPVSRRLALECMRADDLYGPKPIVEDIWQSINEARVILADVTGRNPNVFYEVGLAHAVGKEVVIMTQTIEDVPFDLKHLRCIIYSDSVAGFKKFEAELEETLKTLGDHGEGPQD